MTVDRIGEIYEWKDTGEIFVIFARGELLPTGYASWKVVLLAEATLARMYRNAGTLVIISEAWFTARFADRMRRVA